MNLCTGALATIAWPGRRLCQGLHTRAKEAWLQPSPSPEAEFDQLVGRLGLIDRIAPRTLTDFTLEWERLLARCDPNEESTEAARSVTNSSKRSDGAAWRHCTSPALD